MSANERDHLIPIKVDLDEAPRSILREAWLLIRLFIPIFISRCGWAGMKTTDSAVLGHVGTKYLAASGVSDLWTMTSGIFVQDRVASVLCSQAYGSKRYKMLGSWCCVGLTVLLLICLPVAFLWVLTNPILRFMGVNSELSSLAGYYATVLALCLPFRSMVSLATSFLQSQKILQPAVRAALVALFTNFILAMYFVLYKGYGFPACPFVTVGAEAVQISIFIFYYFWYKGLHKRCWAGWDQDTVTAERVAEYLRLQIPAVMQIGSDFWRMAVVGAYAAAVSQEDVAVFNASYRILWIALTFVGSLGDITSIRIGMKVGAGLPAQAQHIAHTAIITALVICTFSAAIVVVNIEALASIFSSDPVVLTLFYDIRCPLMFTVFFMTLSVLLETIPMASGHTSVVFKAGFVASWCVQVPLVSLFYHQHHSLYAIYTGVACGYAALCFLFGLVILRLDWEQDCRDAILRSRL